MATDKKSKTKKYILIGAISAVLIFVFVQIFVLTIVLGFVLLVDGRSGSRNDIKNVIEAKKFSDIANVLGNSYQKYEYEEYGSIIYEYDNAEIGKDNFFVQCACDSNNKILETHLQLFVNEYSVSTDRFVYYCNYLRNAYGDDGHAIQWDGQTWAGWSNGKDLSVLINSSNAYDGGYIIEIVALPVN